MKKTLLLFSVLCFSIVRLHGQVADGITYQAVALDDKGKEIAGHDINGMIIHSNQIAVRFSVLRGSQDGDVLYQETHNTYTDQYGLFSLVIGHGDETNEGIYQKLTEIKWGEDMLFLKVEIDIRSRGNYKLMGIQQMMAVPFAFHSLTSSAATVHYSDILNKPVLSQVAFSGSYDDLTNKPAFFSGTYDDLINKPVLFNGDYNSLTNRPLIPSKVSDLLNDAGYLTSLTEEDPVWTLAAANYYRKSELQTGGASQVHFDNITNKPTTLAAYGITDVFEGSWADLTGKPTTLSGYGITDAISISHPSYAITETSVNNWNTAFAWGNHSGLYMPVTYIPSWAEITSNPFSFASVENDQLIKYNSTTHMWENWTPDFQDIFTESDPVFADWDKTTGIAITSSQVNDFQAGVTNNPAVLANTAKNSYPLTDAVKLAGVASGAEVNVNADWSATSGDAQILNKPVLATVATSGNYSDLAGLPEIPTQYTDAMADLRVAAGITGKVDQVEGMGLSSNDYTTTEKAKLASIVSGAEVNVNADWNATSGDAQILNKPTFASVALSGNYTDLAGIPMIPTQYTDVMADLRVVAGITGKVDKVEGMGLSSNDYTTAEKTKLASVASGAEVNVNADWNATSGDAQILNKPILSTVATSGNYTDLVDLPTIPTQYTDAMTDLRVVAGITGKVDKVEGMGLSSNDYTTTEKVKLAGVASGAEVNVNADWNATVGDAQILNKPVLSTVATSGNYSDLTGLPTIPIQYTDVMADLRVAAGITGKVDKVEGMDLSSNDYTSIEKSKLSSIASGAEVNVNADWNATSGDSQIFNKPALAAVATTGNYSDLINAPATFSGSYNDLTDKPILHLSGDTLSISGGNSIVLNSTSVTAFSNSTVYSTSGSFNVPATVSRVLVEVWSAGGGGGNGSYIPCLSPIPGVYRGAGGGGGSYGKAYITVTPGQSINVVVGSGGAGGNGTWYQSTYCAYYGYGGQNGGNSSFGNYLIVPGGGGAGAPPGSGNYTGVGGTSVNGTSGANGGTGTGYGGAPPFTFYPTTSLDGETPGGGGNGGYNQTGPGGRGGNGLVIIWW